MKSEEEEAEEKAENLGQKLRRCVLVGKRRGPSTPVRPWRDDPLFPYPTPTAHVSTRHRNSNPQSSSVRKLAAALWEFHHYLPLSGVHGSLSNGTSAATTGGGGGGPRVRRRHPSQHHHQLHKGKGLDLSSFLYDQPKSASSLRRHVAISRALEPVSPASYGSSVEVAPYYPEVTPAAGSLAFKGRIGESHYGLKTSKELVKVLNRIWSLEEQHASNVSLIKALKMELHHAQVRIKELLRDQQTSRHEMDDLMDQIAEDKIIRKSKEQERIHAAVQNKSDELEDATKLRKRSESLHRKSGRDLAEVRSSLSNALKELERERTSRKLLEELCDEFAKGIKYYDQELRALKKRYDEGWAEEDDEGCSILHISESWLDERMQMKLEEAKHGFTDNNSIVDKFNHEIEACLEAKQTGASKNTNPMLPRNRGRISLESFPSNEDSNCFELNKPSNHDIKSHGDETADAPIDEYDIVKTDEMEKKFEPRERVKSRDPSSLQVKFEEQMAWAMSCYGNKRSQAMDAEHGKAREENPDEHNQIHGSSESLAKSHPSLPEGGNGNKNVHAKNDFLEASCSAAAWKSPRNTTPDDLDAPESSPNILTGSKKVNNTLKAKLCDTRSKGKGSRVRILKGSS